VQDFVSRAGEVQQRQIKRLHSGGEYERLQRHIEEQREALNCLNRLRCEVFQRDFVSVARFAFRACSFNHSDISPFRINELPRLNRKNNELCQTSQCVEITWRHTKHSCQGVIHAWSELQGAPTTRPGATTAERPRMPIPETSSPLDPQLARGAHATAEGVSSEKVRGCSARSFTVRSPVEPLSAVWSARLRSCAEHGHRPLRRAAWS
jgi:hypothetical protein